MAYQWFRVFIVAIQWVKGHFRTFQDFHSQELKCLKKLVKYTNLYGTIHPSSFPFLKNFKISFSTLFQNCFYKYAFLFFYWSWNVPCSFQHCKVIIIVICSLPSWRDGRRGWRKRERRKKQMEDKTSWIKSRVTVEIAHHFGAPEKMKDKCVTMKT